MKDITLHYIVSSSHATTACIAVVSFHTNAQVRDNYILNEKLGRQAKALDGKMTVCPEAFHMPLVSLGQKRLLHAG